MEEFYQTVLQLAGLEDTPGNRLEVDVAFDYANQYCRAKYTMEDAPMGFRKGVAVLVQSKDQPINVQRESVAGEMDVTYDTNITAAAARYLDPYRRVVFL